MSDEETKVLQDPAVSGQATQAQEPMDIAQAFQMVREGNHEPAEAPEAEKGGVPEPAGNAGGIPVQEQGQDLGGGMEDTADESGSSAEYRGEDNLGGPATLEQMPDYDVIQQRMNEALEKEARRRAEDSLRKAGVNLDGIRLNQLYEETQDGVSIFRNPDNPHEPFRDRTAAMNWVNTFNGQIQDEVESEQRRILAELKQMAKPAFDLIAFAPYYDAMPSDTKRVFDRMIEPYSVYNQAGEVVSFDCNLPRMARSAEAIASDMRSERKPQQQQQQQVQQQQQQKAPAMDLKSGNGSSPDDREITNMAEAMEAISRMNREKRNGK